MGDGKREYRAAASPRYVIGAIRRKRNG